MVLEPPTIGGSDDGGWADAIARGGGWTVRTAEKDGGDGTGTESD
eukprot:gene9872-32121_t